ncbi:MULTISPECIES: hypothetical protein [Chroococcidiopsis]|jgi:hypothetical protein|uniref:Integral membrane protein n=1 Tax=Chroococcidiopsis thermalis (strain PCC 7203) TaxID=251229 RepID=K9TWS1_CHRTP|nr:MULTISPECIES: hypothetical protein [Chroococcidiopsis]AFY86641.1 hypothetical protein Chro_1112 [Chroococcidiopsis thermalis PCC 7203]URD51518.1 hypothetical protein M5J74_05910 [Chroococcidiopsis sp. CCNUC1]
MSAIDINSEETRSKVKTKSKEGKSPRWSIQQKNWVLSFHIGFATLWTGTVLSMFLIAWRNKDSTNPDILFALNSVINLLDDFVVIPAAIGSVITATLLCWQTNYGFFKFYWVIAKWVLSTALIIFGTFWLFPWANAATEISLESGLKSFQNPLYTFDALGVLLGTLIQVFFLFVIVGISVLKPWGRRTTTEKQAKPTAAS